MDTDSLLVKKTVLSTNFIFHALPQNAEDLAELIAIHTLADPMTTAALWFAAMWRYAESREEGLEMIDILKGPVPLSTYDKSFLRDRFMDKLYLPRVYFEGAAPENNYTPTQPLTLRLYDNPVQREPNLKSVLVKGKGFDSPRAVTLRQKGDSFYLWDYAGTLLSVRLPKVEDPWA